MKALRDYLALLLLCFLVVGTASCAFWYLASFLVPTPPYQFLLAGAGFFVGSVILLAIVRGLE